MSTTPDADRAESEQMSGDSTTDDVAETNGSGDDIYGGDHDADFDSVIPDGKPDSVREAERKREAREDGDNDDQETVEVTREQFDRMLDAVEKVEQLEDTVQQQQARIDELEHELEDTSDTAQKALDKGHGAMSAAQSAQDALIGDMDETFDKDADYFPLVPRLPEDGSGIDDLRQKILEEQRLRGKNDGRIQRMLAEVAEEAGVDLDELNVEGSDKIARLAKNGPTDVVDTVYPVHERAADLLVNITDWGRLERHDGERFYYINSTEARERLELLRDENLQSKQVRDVFEKLDHLSDDSGRVVSAGKTPEGKNRLKIQWSRTEAEKYLDGGDA